MRMARRRAQARGAFEAPEPDRGHPRRRRGLILGAGVLVLLVGGGAAVGRAWDGLPQVPGASATSAGGSAVPQDGCDPATKVDDRRRFLPARDALHLRRTSEGYVLGYCAPDDAGVSLGRDLVDFATGGGPAPEFARRVERWVDGRRYAPVSAGQAARRGTWGGHSPIGALHEIAERVRQGEPVAASPDGQRRLKSDPNGGLVYIEPSAGPYVSVLDGGGDASTGAIARVSGVRCRAQGYPGPLAARDAAVLVIGVSTAPAEPDCDFVDVFTNATGRIDAVVVRTGDGGPAPARRADDSRRG